MQDHCSAYTVTVPGALQLLRTGATLTAQRECSAWRLHTCTNLALAHLWLLLNRSRMLSQVLTVALGMNVSSCC